MYPPKGPPGREVVRKLNPHKNPYWPVGLHGAKGDFSFLDNFY